MFPTKSKSLESQRVGQWLCKQYQHRCDPTPFQNAFGFYAVSEKSLWVKGDHDMEPAMFSFDSTSWILQNSKTCDPKVSNNHFQTSCALLFKHFHI
ncbi:unnamed protein product [Albugo candida]|uniref:Uncharacterized protein n=1 Tax=Albugo candida TaxID=65357 RepID=A0A024GH31_9STRA|nr:unnamed protein product [Albugo candida]|eukprot:CCI46069.1 unnamed protein product [Albugo candida]